ncbi:MAG: cbb3-type cytochrome c oxidase subunit 3 [Deltaproteobacteria bacterium]|nr:cbb3-type cytochrome c oxidase subunit 3 [Deltaproteobacteria bacterium]
MRLSDVVGHSGLSGYAQVALILFVLAFVGVVLRVVARRFRADDQRTARLPLDDGQPCTESRHERA